MARNHSVAIIVLSAAWRTPRATCSPSFVAPRRRSVGRGYISNWSSSPKQSWTSFHCASGRVAGDESPENALGDGSAQSRAWLRQTRERQLCGTAKDLVVRPFTWPDLAKLFRDPDGRDGENVNYIPSDHPNLALFRRSVSDQKSYELHKEYLNSCWDSAYDYLVVSKFGQRFGFDKVVVSGYASDDSEQVEIDGIGKEEDTPPGGCRFRACPSLAQASRYAIDRQITYLSLVPNDYPYDVDEGIEHWCLWKIGGTSVAGGISIEDLTWAVRELNSPPDRECGGRACIVDRDGRTIGTADDTSRATVTNDDGARKPAPISDVLYWVNPPHLQSMPEINHAHILVLRTDERCHGGYAAPNPPPV
jgi:hypothetical protein